MYRENEAQARIKINKLLEEAGWDLTKDCRVEYQVGSIGYADYVLLDKNKKRLAVIEAKNPSKTPLDGKEQARRYAKELGISYVILSNSKEHYFWNIKKGGAKKMEGFLTQEEIIAFRDKENNSTKQSVILKDFEVKENLIANKTLRDYQIEAINSVKKAILEHKKERFLLVMATGTGKTLTAAGIIKMLYKTRMVRKVLFLVDRIELEEQAMDDFNTYYNVPRQEERIEFGIYKKDRDNPLRYEVLITTFQSLLNDYKRFKRSDFDLIISDEAHRSITGQQARKIFDYFECYKLGLTATPKATTKNLDAIKFEKEDFKTLELRKIKDTYETFHCSNFTPTFEYTLEKGAKDNHLILPNVVEIKSEITTELLSKEGHSVEIKDEESKTEKTLTFTSKDYGKKFFSEDTNKRLCEKFLKMCLKDPINGEVGKTIMYCASQKEAAAVTQILNELAKVVYPGKYESNFAMCITSNVGSEVAKYRRDFRNNRLNDRHVFEKKLEDYETSKTRVCVTHSMMTTGYDCKDLLNIVFFRPIFSPSDFIQMKGRGTRKFTFKYKNKEIEKDKFYIFDFFETCEYFEKYFDFKKPLKIIIPNDINISGEPRFKEKFYSKTKDEIRDIIKHEAKIMKIDKAFFESEISKDKGKKIFTFEDFFNIVKEENLEMAMRTFYREFKRRATDPELYKWIVKNEKPKLKDEILHDMFLDFLPSLKFSGNINILRKFFYEYFNDEKLREIIEKDDYRKIENCNIPHKDILTIQNYVPNIQHYYDEVGGLAWR